MTSLSDRKRQVARDHIEETALQLFVERGFDATTVADIAATAGISTRTFFRYFATKEDVVFADHPDEVEKFRAALRATAGAKLPTRVVEALRATRLVEMSDSLRARLHLYATVPAVADRGRRLTSDYLDAVAAVVAEEDPAADPAETLMRAGAIFGALNTIPTLIARDGSRTNEELQRAVARLLEDDMPSLR
jgi:AcrR family transcriptional regulator